MVDYFSNLLDATDGAIQKTCYYRVKGLKTPISKEFGASAVLMDGKNMLNELKSLAVNSAFDVEYHTPFSIIVVRMTKLNSCDWKSSEPFCRALISGAVVS